MKKNLLALVAVLMLVALAARMQRDPEGGALESDLRASLENLWQTREHQVELSEGLLRVQVNLPRDGHLEWNEPFVRFVGARHPRVAVKEFRVSPTGPLGPRIELLRRQTQGLVDSSLGTGQGLILLAGLEQTAQQEPQGVSNRAEEAAPRQAAPRDDGGRSGAPFMDYDRKQANSPPAFFPAGPEISEECLVVAAPGPSDDALRKLQAQIQAQTPCERFRIVRLPAL